jgi:hypothetical protein
MVQPHLDLSDCINNSRKAIKIAAKELELLNGEVSSIIKSSV